MYLRVIGTHNGLIIPITTLEGDATAQKIVEEVNRVYARGDVRPGIRGFDDFTDVVVISEEGCQAVRRTGPPRYGFVPWGTPLA
jgi:hypothetical protein